MMIRRFWRVALMIVLAGAALWWFLNRGESSGDKAEPAAKPVAKVKVAPIRAGTLTEDLTVYGAVLPAAGATRTVTVPYESRIRRILVTEGQHVSPGAPLVEIEPSAETALQLQQARNDYDGARKAFQFMQQRFDLKLATNDQMLQARQALDQAQAKLESMRRRGSEAPRTINADQPSLISKISAQEGAIVPGGNPMMETVDQNRLDVRLGIEPADIRKVRSGEEVSLSRVNAPGKIVRGKIRKLSGAANATSHLVDAFIDLPSASGFLLNESVVGKIPVASAEGLIVPRSAVLPEEERYLLFTVKDGHAVQHDVQIRLENQGEVEIDGKDLRPGDSVVILGNYELRNGMPVELDSSR